MHHPETRSSCVNTAFTALTAGRTVTTEFGQDCIEPFCQFLSTFLITGLYVRFANRELDPRAAAIRTQLESEIR